MNEPASSAVLPAARPLRPGFAAALVFLSGASVLVLEILSLRLIAPYVGLTLEMNSAVIGVALTAIAVGAWFGGQLADRFAPDRLLGPLFLIGGALTLIVSPSVRWTGETFGGDGGASALSVAGIAIFAPAAILSAISPVVVKASLGSLSNAGSIVGKLSSFGTLGAILATFGTGFVLVALLPTTTILTGLGIMLVAIGLALFARRMRGAALAMVLIFAGVGVAAAARAPQACDVETRYHCIVLAKDPERDSGRILYLNSASHSYIDLDDPEYLKFAYAQTMRGVLDATMPTGPLTTLQIGAGGLTLPRYLAHARPGTTSLVYEVDGGLVDFNRDHLGYNSREMPGVDVRTRDGRLGTADAPAGRYDLVIGDAAGEDTVPWHLATVEYTELVHRSLRDGGIYLLNLIDGPRQRLIHAEAATLAEKFENVAVIATGPRRDGEYYGNFVLVASDAAIPVDAITASLPDKATIVADPANLRTYTDGAKPLTDNFAPVDQLGET